MADSLDSLTVPTFKGVEGEDVTTWLKQFERFCVYKKLNNDQKLASFGLLLRGQAAIWYQGLDDNITSDLAAVKDRLKQTYSLSKNSLWKKERDLFSKVQGPQESVHSYVANMRAACRDLEISEAQLVRLICSGLRQELRPFILSQNLGTVEEVIAAASRIESATTPNQDPNLLAEIKELRAELATLRGQSVNAIASATSHYPADSRRPRSPSPHPRRPSPAGTRDFTRGNTPHWTQVNQSNPRKVTFQRQYPCQGCGKLDHARLDCFARDLMCNFCGKIGHIRAVCRSARRESNH